MTPKSRLAGDLTTEEGQTGPVTRQAQDTVVASPVRGGGQIPSAGTTGADSVPADGSRTWTIALPAGLELLSLNDRLHWRERHRRYQCIKFAAYVTARDAKIPPLGRVRIVVEYQPPDRRHRDADNPMAAAKAAVDGVVLAGCLEDDECPRYVTGIWATIGPVYPKGRLVLHLAEVAEIGGAA
jgi:crossover junction endodeoxyribonuclease RusA